MARALVTLHELNVADQERFEAILGFVFEDSPWIAAAAWHDRPWSTLDDLHRSLCAVMYHSSTVQQIALIRAHPDLVGRAALVGTLTPASTSEQASAGLDRLSPEEIEAFMRLNAAYRDRFDFPFVICVRENKKASILAGFETRLRHTPSIEIGIALDEIAKIARLRLLDTVVDG
jgi:2-oxo-4-hydroxy-4-carboxy-5-ureidoimidazoline decarboxylase